MTSSPPQRAMILAQSLVVFYAGIWSFWPEPKPNSNT